MDLALVDGGQDGRTAREELLEVALREAAHANRAAEAPLARLLQPAPHVPPLSLPELSVRAAKEAGPVDQHEVDRPAKVEPVGRGAHVL